jgi:predicted double-glycine peptidase
MPTAPTAAAPEAAKPAAQGAILSTHSAIGVVPVRNWKALRDERIVKQDLDYSCGAASLATLLNYYYGQHLTEAQILAALDQGDGMASFADMARVLPQFGPQFGHLRCGFLFDQRHLLW